MSNKSQLKPLRPNVGFLLKEAAGYSRLWEVELPTTALEQDVSVEWLRGQLEFTRTSEGIWVNGRLAAAAPAECARCLTTFSQPLELTLEELFYYPPSNAPTRSDYVVTEDSILDLVGPVREQIVLSTPMRPLCRPDCKGFCATCGAYLDEEECQCQKEEVDPRLAVLRGLLSDDHPATAEPSGRDALMGSRT
jgi:uncharacterized protein